MVVELKIDPDDQRTYTIETLKEKYAGSFTTDEIEAYWEEDCTALPVDQYPSAHRIRCEEKAHPEPSRTETRIDPEDGISYFFEDFVTKHENHFEKADIIDYWFKEMRIDLPDGTKLFVSNLSKETREEQLRSRFAAFGELAKCEVHRDAAEASKGFATVQYTSIQAAEKALAAMNRMELDGAKLVVQELLDRKQTVSIFVGGIPKDVTAEELEQAFSPCGQVGSCSVFHDPGNQAPKGQARINFIFPKSVQQAVDEFHAKAAFRGQKVVVMPWREDPCGRRVPGPSVFVAKVAPETSEQRLRELFESVGIMVVNLMIFKNKETLESRGIGKVELADEASVQRAVQALHGVELDGAKGGCTKYLTLQFLNYARWTSQQHSCNLPGALQIMARNYLWSPEGKLMPLGVFKMWWPYVTLLNETVHWGMKVPLAMRLYNDFREAGLGPHLGLFAGVALSSLGEVAVTGWSERFGVHMGLRQISSYSESLQAAREARGSLLAGAYAGAAGLWLRNFSWNFAFFEWKRYLHNAVEHTPEGAPAWFVAHLEWLRKMDKKNQANVLTFEAATLGTYLTFFNMAGDNVKTKMQYDPVRYPSVVGTVTEIYTQHGLLGFARGSLFKGIYLILGATVAIGIQERLTEIMAALMKR